MFSYVQETLKTFYSKRNLKFVCMANAMQVRSNGLEDHVFRDLYGFKIPPWVF